VSVHSPQEIPKIDKAMLVLLYLADNVDDINFKVTLDMLDQEFEGLMDGGDQKMTLAKAFQVQIMAVAKKRGGGMCTFIPRPTHIIVISLSLSLSLR
jgi:hypothetical protein